jgi:hypothetical protein
MERIERRTLLKQIGQSLIAAGALSHCVADGGPSDHAPCSRPIPRRIR